MLNKVRVTDDLRVPSILAFGGHCKLNLRQVLDVLQHELEVHVFSSLSSRRAGDVFWRNAMCFRIADHIIKPS